MAEERIDSLIDVQKVLSEFLTIENGLKSILNTMASVAKGLSEFGIKLDQSAGIKQTIANYNDQLNKIKNGETLITKEAEKQLIAIEKIAQAKNKTVAQEQINHQKVQREIEKTTHQTEKFNKAGSTASNTWGKALSSFQMKFNTLGNFIGTTLYNSIVKLGTAMVNTLKESTEKFLDAEEVTQKLKFAVLNVGGESNSALAKLNSQAEKLMGIFDDKAIRTAQTDLINFGLTAEETYNLIPFLIDTAAQSGRELSDVTSAVIRGIEGQGKGLKTLGIELKSGASEAENLATIQEQLKKYTGGASDALETQTGQLKKLKNELNETSETAGASLVIWEKFWAKMKAGFVDVIATLIDYNTMAKSIQEKTAALGSETYMDKYAKLTVENKTKYLEVAKTKLKEYTDLLEKVGKGEATKNVFEISNLKANISTLEKFIEDVAKLSEVEIETKSNLSTTSDKLTTSTTKLTEEKEKEVVVYTDLQKQVNSYKLQLEELNDTDEKQAEWLNAKIDYYEEYISLQEKLTEGTITQAEYTDLLAIEVQKLDNAEKSVKETQKELLTDGKDFIEHQATAIDAIKEQEDAVKNLEESFKKMAENATEFGSSVGKAMGDALKKGEDVAKAAAKAALLTSLKQLKDYIEAKIALEALASAESVATFGVAGLAKAAIMTGIVEGIYSLVVSQISGYAKGRKGGPAELAIVGEKGSELVVAGSQAMITPDKPTLTYLPSGADVIPNDKLMKAMYENPVLSFAENVNNAIELEKVVNGLSGVKQAIMNKKEAHFIIDKNGFRTLLKNGNSWTEYIDNVVRL